MTLVESLPNRPLTFAETCRRDTIDGVDIVAPMYATIDASVASEEDLVVAAILLRRDVAEFVGFDPASARWKSVTRFPDIADGSGVFASLDVLESWLFERYTPAELVQIDVEF